MHRRRLIVEQNGSSRLWWAWFTSHPSELFVGRSWRHALTRLTGAGADERKFHFEKVAGSEGEGRIEMNLIPVDAAEGPEDDATEVYVGMGSRKVEPTEAANAGAVIEHCVASGNSSDWPTDRAWSVR